MYGLCYIIQVHFPVFQNYKMDFKAFWVVISKGHLLWSLSVVLLRPLLKLAFHNWSIQRGSFLFTFKEACTTAALLVTSRFDCLAESVIKLWWFLKVWHCYFCFSINTFTNDWPLSWRTFSFKILFFQNNSMRWEMGRWELARLLMTVAVTRSDSGKTLVLNDLNLVVMIRLNLKWIEWRRDLCCATVSTKIYDLEKTFISDRCGFWRVLSFVFFVSVINSTASFLLQAYSEYGLRILVAFVILGRSDSCFLYFKSMDPM